VYDGLGTDPQRLLHDEAIHDIPLADSPRFVTTGTIRIAGRPWTVVFTSTRAFDADSSGGGVWILTLVLGVAASLVLFLVTGRQAAAREDADALALRLQESTTALERQVGEIQVLN